jgi:hypothetical protein
MQTLFLLVNGILCFRLKLADAPRRGFLPRPRSRQKAEYQVSFAFWDKRLAKLLATHLRVACTTASTGTAAAIAA